MKEKHIDINENNNSIRCRIMTETDSRTFEKAVVVTHGFGSSKDVANTTKFAEKYLSKNKDAVVFAFDWPCHGQDGKKKLELSDCMDYMTLVVHYLRDNYGVKDIYNYSVSFGGYLTLKYIAEIENPFTKIALRAPGIHMYELMLKNVGEENMGKVEKGKDVEVGFERKMKIDKTLLEDLQKSDVTKYEYFDYADSMIVIHGTADEMVPFDDSKTFCENNVIEFVPIEGADHAFRNPKMMDTAIHTIIEWFA